MNINLIVGGETAKAVLEDNATTRDFVALLPMTVMLEDFAGKEKIKRLSRNLSTSGQPASQSANVWDIAYYVPWGNIAIFYQASEPAPGLIKMGRVLSGQEILTKAPSFSVRIEAAP